jgi:hypothetical protein
VIRKNISFKNFKMNVSLPGNWKVKKEKLRKKYQFLSEKDLHFTEGKENEMIELLRSKLGKTKQELLSIIVEL